MAGVGIRLLEFIEFVQLMLGGDQLLSKERKNQTKFDLLTNQDQAWTFSLFWVAKQSFKQQLECHQVGNKPSGKYNFSQDKKKKKFKTLLFESCFIS